MPRPRLYPPGTEPRNKDYLKASRHALAERGGKILQVRLEPEEVKALERLRAAHSLTSDRDAIGLAIMTAVRKR
jgi:hypothetical protein